MSEQRKPPPQDLHDSHAEHSELAAVDEASRESNEPAFGQDPQPTGQDTYSSDQRLADAQRQVLLAQAELENFRKRMQRESEQQLKYASLPLIRDLLEVIDNLQRATESAEHESATGSGETPRQLLDGVKMVLQQLKNALAHHGCQPIEALGQPFDPNIHEAISQMPSQQYAAGLVAHEVGVGYLLHDRVVRPSAVVVSSGPQAS